MNISLHYALIYDDIFLPFFSVERQYFWIEIPQIMREQKIYCSKKISSTAFVIEEETFIWITM